ncbi:MAG: LamG domain-containing protein [Candidatus Eremiobacteraeota bacterium]|nr:LamG domain-containing protein [Candidatus Eremiobacteraeota bacterium]
MTLPACGRGNGSHALPPSAGVAGGGASSAQRKPRAINEAAYPNAVLLDHPIAYYRLDDTGSTMSDAGSNALNGTYGSAVTRNAGGLVLNSIDPAASFPGGAWSATSIATVPQNALLQPSSVTIEAWVSERAANSSGYIDLISYGAQAGQGYSLQLSPTNTLKVWANTTGAPGYVQLNGVTVLTPGTAYHVVATYDGTTAKLYVNGVLDATAPGASSISYANIGTYGLSIGAGQSTSRNVFNGTVDDVSVFSSALSSTQVTAHYAAAQSAPDDPYAQAVMTDLPAAYYRLDDAGTAMYDATNNRINGAYGSGITKRASGLVANSTDKAAAFPGGAWSANSIATVPKNALLQPTSVSIETWLKEAAANSSGYIDLVSYGTQSGQGYSLQLTPTNTLKLWLTTTGAPGYVELNGVTALTSGTAYHVAATYDGTTAKLYLNGVLNASATGASSVNYANIGSYGLSIGAGQSTTRNVFNGTLDEVAVYPLALTATQVSAHYSAAGSTASQTGPAHIQTMAYYEPGRDSAATPQYILRHVDWAIAESTDGSLVNSFRAAGGLHSVWYTDPTTIYYCHSPFGPPSQNTPGGCDNPLGDTTLNTDESAWLHGVAATTNTDSSGYASPPGARLHSFQDTNHFLWGNALNPGSSHVKTAYAALTTSVTNSNTIDSFWMDDSNPHYQPGLYWNYATDPTEYAGTGGAAQYNSDMIALACKASRPVFFNGPSWDPIGSDSASTKADDTAMLSSPCVRGALLEGAFVGSSSRKNLNQGNPVSTFVPGADRALLVQSLGKISLILTYLSCASGSSGCTFDPVGDRLYGLGGIWLVYDPRFTLAWNVIDANAGDPNMVNAGVDDQLVAEFGIVPTQPYQTAVGNDITNGLQIANGHTAGAGSQPGGPFRREFAQCYQNGASIGRCAVVLNAESVEYTSGGVESMPTLGHTYSSSLVLNDKPADAGGTATWTGTVPTTLQPTTAVILKQ